MSALGLGIPLLLGCFAFGDYGLSWDEPLQRTLGRQAWKYVVQGRQAYLQNDDRVYGPAFELVLFGAERALGIDDSRPAFLLRHLLTFLAFWGAGVVFFLLARRLLRSWQMGLAAAMLLFLSPRIVADGFYNSKDLPFLSFFVLGVFTLFRFLDRPSLSRALVHGLACALATDIRIMGVLLIPLTALGVLANGLPGPHRSRWFVGALVAATTYVAAVLLFWPFLWQDPLHRFAEAFAVMAHYPWQGTVLFMGKTSPVAELPWFYVPVWIGITTPLSVLLLVPIGIVGALRRALRGGDGRTYAAVVLPWLFLPLLAVWGLRSALYDGWRQMYFIYPALLLLAAFGLRTVWQLGDGPGAARWKGVVRMVVAGLLVVDVVGTAAWMAHWHPYQNMYFNRLAGSRASLTDRFETDYWGLSTRRLLEHVVVSDPRPSIAVVGYDWYAQLLPLDDRQRLRFVTSAAEADYIVTTYRYGTVPPAGTSEVFSVRVDSILIGSVFETGRMHRNRRPASPVAAAPNPPMPRLGSGASEIIAR